MEELNGNARYKEHSKRSKDHLQQSQKNPPQSVRIMLRPKLAHRGEK